MAVLSAANVIAHSDKLGALWLAALGNATYGLGTVSGGGGGMTKATDLQAAIIALADTDQVVALLPAAQQLAISLDAYAAIGEACRGMIDALDRDAAASALANVRTLDQFANYYNLGAGGPWACLFAPAFVEFYKACKSGAYPTKTNCYFEILQGGTYANGLRKLVVGTGVQTAGTDIDATVYAGGFGQVKVSGWAGAADTVTVTGTWRSTDGSTHTAAGTVSVGADGTFVLTPPAANELLIAVTGIAAGALITAGTIYAEAKRPAGRTNPPT